MLFRNGLVAVFLLYFLFVCDSVVHGTDVEGDPDDNEYYGYYDDSYSSHHTEAAETTSIGDKLGRLESTGPHKTETTTPLQQPDGLFFVPPLLNPYDLQSLHVRFQCILNSSRGVLDFSSSPIIAQMLHAAAAAAASSSSSPSAAVGTDGSGADGTPAAAAMGVGSAATSLLSVKAQFNKHREGRKEREKKRLEQQKEKEKEEQRAKELAKMDDEAIKAEAYKVYRVLELGDLEGLSVHEVRDIKTKYGHYEKQRASESSSSMGGVTSTSSSSATSSQLVDSLLCDDLLCGSCKAVVEAAVLMVQSAMKDRQTSGSGDSSSVEAVDTALRSAGLCDSEAMRRLSDLAVVPCRLFFLNTSTIHYKALRYSLGTVRDWTLITETQVASLQRTVCLRVGACSSPAPFEVYFHPVSPAELQWNDSCWVCLAYGRALRDSVLFSRQLTDAGITILARQACNKLDLREDDIPVCSGLYNAKDAVKIVWHAKTTGESLRKNLSQALPFALPLCEKLSHCARWIDSAAEEKKRVAAEMERVFF